MSHSSNLALLVTAYQRVDTVGQILEIASFSGVNRVYIVIDRAATKSNELIQEKIALLCEDYRPRFSYMHVIRRDRNVGCAASIISSIDWVFKNEEYLCILEDDCIPTSDFFEFVRASKKYLESEGDILLTCGTQFAPKALSNGKWIKSKYALTWGWATTKSNWSLIRSSILLPSRTSLFDLSIQSIKKSLNAEDRYWASGARRARAGYVDVWDTVLLEVMRTQNKFSILPPESLVVNIGDDIEATHTQGSEWTHQSVGGFVPQDREPKVIVEVDAWLKKFFFKISARHLISTRITHLVDVFKAPKLLTLSERFYNNQINEL